MGILLLFNDIETITAEDIQIETQLSDVSLKTTLMALVKMKVLLISPKNSKGITKKNKFKLNPNFKNKKQRVMINIPVREINDVNDNDNVEDNKNIEEDRKIHIQAAIVRVMKSRDQLNHVQLIGAVVDQLKSRFKPKIPVIKKSIDMLLEKGYLARVEAERDTFKYVA